MKDVAAGRFVAIEYCFGYLFTAEYGGKSGGGSNGRIRQWEIEDDYDV